MHVFQQAQFVCSDRPPFQTKLAGIFSNFHEIVLQGIVDAYSPYFKINTLEKKSQWLTTFHQLHLLIMNNDQNAASFQLFGVTAVLINVSGRKVRKYLLPRPLTLRTFKMATTSQMITSIHWFLLNEASCKECLVYLKFLLLRKQNKMFGTAFYPYPEHNRHSLYLHLLELGG